MRFDVHQQKVLATTLDSLLCYVNERCHIVRALEGRDGQDRALRSQLVARYVWDHLDLIDDFVRDNPDRLSKAHLDIAQDLSGTLYGTLYLESCDRQSAVLTHRTGVYTVASPDDSFIGCNFDDCLKHGPIELRGAIAPFCGMIVPIPPFCVMGGVSATHLRGLHDDLSKQGTGIPTGDARVLARRAHAWHAKREREQAQKQHASQLGPGYHRGILAGLAAQERERIQAVHAEEAARSSGVTQRIMDTLSVEVDRLPTSMEEALLALDDNWLSDIAVDLGDGSTPPMLPTEQLVTWIRAHVQQDEEGLDLALTWCLDEQFDLLSRLVRSNPITLDELPPTVATHLYPMIPYTFVFRHEHSYVAWMPPEVTAALAEVDLEAASQMRARLREARMAACGLATMCGIISMHKAYEWYRKAAKNPLSRRQFSAVLDEFQNCASRDDYALWRHRNCDYVVSVEISDASAAARVVRERFADHIVDDGMLPDGTQLVELTATDDEELLALLVQQKERELEQARLSLLDKPRPPLPPELPAAMLTDSPIQALMKLGALQALRTFVDAHIPDDQDDYEFGTLFCRSVVVSVTLMCDSYNDTMDLIRLYGMQRCEGTNYSDTLGRLVTNAYNALPRWDLNGWSLEQNTERLTGRRRFFNDDGTLRELRDSDPCPCGSGKSYGHCCGNL